MNVNHCENIKAEFNTFSSNVSGEFHGGSHAANKSRLIDFLGYFVFFFVVDGNLPIMERDINQPYGKISTL